MTGFHHTYETPADATAREHAAEMADNLKKMQEWMGVIAIAAGIWSRNGPSEALRQQIADAGKNYGECLTRIMDSQAPRLTAPTATPNRY